MTGDLLVFVEQREGKVKRASLEALAEARRIARGLQGKVIAVILGNGLEMGAGSGSRNQELAGYGADAIHVMEDPLLSRYSSEGYCQSVAGFVQKTQPTAILIAGTAMGKDLAPRLAARLGTGFIGDCLSISLEINGTITAVRPMYGGKIWATVEAVPPGPHVVTLRPNVFSAGEPDPTRTATLHQETASVKSDQLRAVVKEVLASVDAKVELTEAQVIVSGGRGLKAPENFKLIEDLAEALGAAVGASRAAVDAGWRPHAFQVGLTGKTVTPTLYIACGISGAIQHLAGMSSSKYIVAINKDPNAPIFKVADIGIVGDLFEILPILTEEVRKMRHH